MDIYSHVPKAARAFLYIPEISSASAVTFSAKFETEEQLLASLKGTPRVKVDEKLEALSRKLESLQQLQTRLSASEIDLGIEKLQKPFKTFTKPKFSEIKKIEISPTEKDSKIGEAVQVALPSMGKDKKIEPEKRRIIRIKKVSEIKPSKKKD
ncbi:MAG: hypothetical protein WCT85_02185, partial [Parachlamydiales bacterium]